MGKSWMMFFGLKPTTSREFMVKRLTEVNAYLIGLKGTSSASAEVPSNLEAASAGTALQHTAVPSCVAKRKGRPKKKPKQETGGAQLHQGCSHGVNGEAPPPLLDSSDAQKAHVRSVRSAAKVSELEQLAADVIRKDTELYERLLMFEPVAIGEIRERIVAMDSRLQALGEGRLRQFLDSQGLLFASAWRDDPKAHRTQ